MKLASRLFEKVQNLVEKLIIVNKGKKAGQVIFLAGGGASGKGFARDEFIDVQSYKKFDVDDTKTLLMKVHKLKGDKGDKRVANANLKDPEDVRYLHQFVKDHKLEDKLLSYFFNSIDKTKELPNILFDITFKDDGNFNEKTAELKTLGYRPEDIHIVWVLKDFAEASGDNKTRPRTVPEDILLATHVGAGKTMGDLINGNLHLKDFNGEMYVILNLKELTKVVASKLPNANKNARVIEDFTYIKLKDAGSGFNKNSATAIVKQWIARYVPT